MAEQLVVKTDAEPTMFNKEMAIGSLLFFPVGTLVGGWIGKRRMENERVAGKVLSSEPSFWNKDTLLGGLLGDLIGGITAAAIGIAALVAMGPGASAGTVMLVKGGIAAGGLLGMLVGGYIGGTSGQEDLKKEYQEAKIVQHVSQNVSPELGQAVEYTMEHNKEWGRKMLEEKLLAAGQQNQPPVR